MEQLNTMLDPENGQQEQWTLSLNCGGCQDDTSGIIGVVQNVETLPNEVTTVIGDSSAEVLNQGNNSSGIVAANNITATIFLDPNGGFVTPSTITRLIGSQIGTLPIATRGGHSFEGWYWQGMPIFTTTLVGGSATITARWTQQPGGIANITFNPAGGSVSEQSRMVQMGAQLGALPLPSRPGFRFTGWICGLTGQVMFPTSFVAGNSMFFATWSEQAFNHISSAPISFFVSQPTQDLFTRTHEIINFNHSRAANNANYQHDLSMAGGNLLSMHLAMSVESYVLPFTNQPSSNLSQGFWGNFSHAGSSTPPNHNSRGAIDIGTGGRAGLALFSMLNGTVRNIQMRVGGGSFIDIESVINGVVYTIRYLHIDDRAAFPTPQSLGIRVGDIVQKGARIGTVGGAPNWALHLDLQVIQNGRNLDPLRFFDLEKKYAVSYVPHF